MLRQITILGLFLTLTNLSAQTIARVDSIRVDSTGKIYWQTYSNAPRVKTETYIFKWDHWEKVAQTIIYPDTVPWNKLPLRDSAITILKPETNKIKISVSSLNDSQILFTDSISFYNKTKTKSEFIKVSAGKVILDQNADYRVYDQYGEVVLKGKSTTVSFKNMIRGMYYLDVWGTTFKSYELLIGH
jgi:hypothetical protein